MPKSYSRSCSKSIRLPEHPRQNHNPVRVPRAYRYQSIHAKIIIPFVFQEHTVTRASMPKSYSRSCSKSIPLPEHPCQNHSPVRIPRAYRYQSIHAKIILPFVFQEHTVTRASMPKSYSRSCSKSIRLPEHPCQNHNPVRVPRAYGYQGIHAKIILPFVFQEHTVTRASMPKSYSRSCSKSIRLPEHPCQNHTPVRVPKGCTVA